MNISTQSSQNVVKVVTSGVPAIVGRAIQGPPGPALYTHKGAWSSSVTYIPGPPADLVTHGGSQWAALRSSTNSTPATNNPDWVLISSYGAASNVTAAAYGTNSSTTVQAQLNELADDKLDKAGGTLTGTLTISNNGDALVLNRGASGKTRILVNAPSAGNDPSFIEWDESVSNSAVMRISISDDTASNDSLQIGGSPTGVFQPSLRFSTDGKLTLGTPNVAFDSTNLYRSGVNSMKTDGNFFAIGSVNGNILVSNVTTGTAPLTVSSSTVVTNLNADLLDGLHSGSFMRTDANTATTGTLTVSGVSTFNSSANFSSGIYRNIGQSSGTQTDIFSTTYTLNGTKQWTGRWIKSTNGEYILQFLDGTDTFVNNPIFYNPATQALGLNRVSVYNQITSTVATGTAPFSVASTTVNANLNSDYLDGYHGVDYTRKAENAVVPGDWDYTNAAGLKITSNTTGVRLAGNNGVLDIRNAANTAYADIRVNNLYVTGTTTTVASETVTIADNILLLNSNVTGAATENGGINIERGTTGTDASLIWNESATRWRAGLVGSEVDLVLTTDTSTTAVANTVVRRDGAGSIVGTNIGATSAVIAPIVDITAFDLKLGTGDQVSRGNSGTSRALVKHNGATLVVNFAGDFGGGVSIQGNTVTLPTAKLGVGQPAGTEVLEVTGNIKATGNLLGADLIVTDVITGDTQTNTLTVNHGSGSFSLKPGASDHTYIQFFARTASPTTRSGFLGYPTTGSTALTVSNQIGIVELASGASIKLNAPFTQVSNASDDTRVYANGNISSAGALVPHFTSNFTINSGGIGSGTSRFTIDSTGNVSMANNGGNVGIGTATPSAKLDVNGTIKATALNIPTVTIASTVTPANKFTLNYNDTFDALDFVFG